VSYEFIPSVKASLAIRRVPDVAPVPATKALSDVYPDVPAELFATSIERKMGFGASEVVGLSRAIRAVALGLLAAEIDRAFLRKGGKRLDSRYGTIAGLIAVIGMEI
jgi:hypothetical protein